MIDHQPAVRTAGDRSGLADRYPRRRTPRLVTIAAVALIAAVGIGWLLWAAWEHSRPPVSGAVHVWHVDSAARASFTLTVDRPDPSVPVSCRVIAQARNFETVGEKTISVGAADTRLVDIRDSVRTLRRATSVSLSRCWVQP